MSLRVVQDDTVPWIQDRWVERTSSCNAHCCGVLRIPFDHCVSHRPGARFGPSAIVDAFNGYAAYCVDKRTSFEHFRFIDFGEVDVGNEMASSHRSVSERASRLPELDLTIFLGGDHSLSDPIIRGIANRRGGADFGVIVFDAHLDSRPPRKGREHSGHWVWTLQDVLDYQRLAQLGINANIYSDAYIADAERRGTLVMTPYEIRRASWRSTIAKAIERTAADTGRVYISIDIDALDQSCAPGTSVPNPCGLFAHEVCDAVFEIASQVDVIAVDVMEVSPILDRDAMTAHVAAQVLINLIAGKARYLLRSEKR